MKTAIQFGAGNIGRGFIGAVLAKSGYKVIFADVNQPLIDRINTDRAYTVNIMDTKKESFLVTDVSAVNSNSEDAIRSISDADIVTTAVGVRVLPYIAPTLAKSIRKRKSTGTDKALNIIACENKVMATSILKQEVLKRLTPEERDWCTSHVGFADCSVDRIVPPIHSGNPTDVSVEKYFEWNVDETALMEPLPEIDGMHLVQNQLAYVERKLFTLNTGHAITAYLGFRKGYSTITESIADPDIVTTVRGAMRESGMVLVHRFGFDKDAHFSYIEKILDRLRNPYLADEVTRVAREPLRKLSHEDRLVSPLLGTTEYGLPHANLIKGIAAALHYSSPDDPQSEEMQKTISEKGLQAAVAEITGLLAESGLVREIVEAYSTL